MLVRVTSSRILVKIKKVIMNLKLLPRKKVFSPGRELFFLWSVSWPRDGRWKCGCLPVEMESEMLFHLGPHLWLIHPVAQEYSTHLLCSSTAPGIGDGEKNQVFGTTQQGRWSCRVILVECTERSLLM